VAGEVAALLSVPLSRSEVKGMLNLKSQVNFRERFLDPALSGGSVEMSQPDSPQSPPQKYRQTDAGRKILEKNSYRGNAAVTV
jgi:ATP-dependent DNA helicase RecG